jgi:excinuclease ABC subunit B
VKAMRQGIEADASRHRRTEAAAKSTGNGQYITLEYVEALEQEMLAAAESLEFERAAAIRDRVMQLRDHIGKPLSDIEIDAASSRGGSSGRGRRGKMKSTTKRTKIPRPKQV